MLGKPLVRFCEGSGINSGHGRDIVAPSENQTENRENKLRPKARGVPDLLEKYAKYAKYEKDSGVRVSIDPFRAFRVFRSSNTMYRLLLNRH